MNRRAVGLGLIVTGALFVSFYLLISFRHATTHGAGAAGIFLLSGSIVILAGIALLAWGWKKWGPRQP